MGTQSLTAWDSTGRENSNKAKKSARAVNSDRRQNCSGRIFLPGPGILAEYRIPKGESILII